MNSILETINNFTGLSDSNNSYPNMNNYRKAKNDNKNDNDFFKKN